MKFNIKTASVLFIGAALMTTSCKKFLDVNRDPDNIPSTEAPIAQLLTNAQVNMAFEGGSDLYRFTSIIAQHLSGQASQPNQTYEYDRYNITGNDQNNVWSSIFATTLNDLDLVINTATTNGSPHYSGVAKIMKAYEYSLAVDTWGNVPFTEAQQMDKNVSPKFDDGATIYPKLITMLDEGIAEVNAATSNLTPGTNSVIYPGAFATRKTNWVKAANVLKLRLLLHMSKNDPASLTAMTTLINGGGPFFTANADNFQLAFNDIANQRNPIQAFEVSRPNYLFAHATMVNLMNTKADPRRPFYFTEFPYGSGNYKGVSAGDPATVNYSRPHVYLRGPATGTPVVNAQGGITTQQTYNGTAPIRMLTFAEYNFIRAEHAMRTANPAAAQTFFTAGITASMEAAGVSAANIAAYLLLNGTLTGTPANMQKQISEEKWVAMYGVSVEPWSEWRRTGYPALTLPSNRMATVPNVPRSLFYPQSEIDFNPNAPAQKPADLQTKVFWD